MESNLAQNAVPEEMQMTLRRINKCIDFLEREVNSCTTVAEEAVVFVMMKHVFELKRKQLDKIMEITGKRKVKKRKLKRRKKSYSNVTKLKVLKLLASENPPTQVQVAKMVGVSSRCVSRWWRGAIKDGVVKLYPGGATFVASSINRYLD